MAMELIRRAYDRLAGQVADLAQDVAWSVRNKPAHLDQLACYLRRIGVSPSQVNRYLARSGIEGSFQQAVATDVSLVVFLTTDALTMSSYPHSSVFSPDEKREYIGQRVVDRLKA